MSESRNVAAALAAAVQRWSLPQVEGNVVGRVRDDRASSAAERKAAQEHITRGYQEGLAQADAQMKPRIQALDAQIAQLDSVLQLLSRPLQQLDEEMERQLVQLALAVGKQLARRELQIDPTQIIGIIREALGQLPSAARDVRVHLHPEDAATVRERLAAPSNDRAWTLVEDPTLSRGGCIVRTDMSQIDVRLESRISAVVASALGDERAVQRRAPGAD
ncbi:MAG TPA: flagellar assembly protein FliH [Steroidobacteraceae bacterium]|nr:flagellar assembly protein FliH [Steroidobacteraceae bacterium]